MRRTILFVLGLLLLTACQRVQPINPYVGKEGLTITFGQNAPPDEIVEGLPFPVRVLASNKGAADVPYNKLLLLFSADPLYIGGGLAQVLPKDAESPGNISRVIHGVSLAWPQGETRLFSVPPARSFVSREVLGTRERPETTLRVSACYAYSTLLTTTVCIDSNLYGDNLREQVCTGKDLPFSTGQGAPVEVTRVEVETFPIIDPLLGEESIRPSFTITVRNAGDGTVVGPSNLEMGTACLLRSIPKGMLGAVSIDAWLSSTKLECTPKLVGLYDGEGSARCTVPMNDLTDSVYKAKQNFRSTLIVNLTYLYLSSVEKTISIRRKHPMTPDDTLHGEISGYVYEGGALVYDEHGNPKTRCEVAAASGEIGFVGRGWSCACSQEECLKRSRRGTCTLQYGLCPEPTYCCGEREETP